MKKILSILLTLCMIVSMLPVSAMAEEIHTPIGTSGEIIAFEPLAETEKSVSLGTSIEDLEFPETVTATVRTAVPIGEDSVQDSEWVENTMDIPVRRTSEPEYDMDTEGVYVFAPVIEGYTVSAPLPQVTVTVGEMPSIAAVVLDSGGAAKDSYDTFENALDHAETGETVKLLKEITLAAPASITDKSIILDLNGKKLTSAWPQTLTYTGTSDKTLTITDSADGGVVENTYGPKEGKALVNNRTGTVEILGGTIRSTGVYGYGIHNASTGTITVSGGSVEATGDQYASMYYYRARAIDNSGGGVVNISGTAQVTGVTGNGYAITSNKASGVVNISGGVVSSENNFALGGSESGRIKGRVNITGGEIRSGIDLANGTTVNISGGTLAPGKISVPVDSTLVITGGNMGFNLYGGVAVNGQVPPVTVVPYVLTIPGEGNKAVTELTVTPELDYTYGMNDVKTDDNGNLTVCLPLGKTGVSVTIDGTTYSGETVRVSEEYSNRGYTATLTPPAPSYTITASPTSKDFGSLAVGYSVPAAQTVTITNTGNSSVTLTQPTSTNYTIGALSTITLAANGTATFTVTPKTGLAVGNYNETLTVSTNHSTNATVSLSFSVVAVPTITGQPSPQTVNVGQGATFSVTATGTGLTYQWQVNTGSGFTNISNGGVYSGTTTATLTITGVTAGMNGYQYCAIVSGTVAPAATSNSATLTVNAAPTYTISGTIKGSDTGSGIFNAVVRLKSGGSNVGSPVLTDENGAYTISNVSAGTYSIEVSTPNYNNGTISSFTVSASVTGKDLTLTSIVIFTPVTDIAMTNAASVQVGSDLTLTGIVSPANATNQSIVWSIESANGTGATIIGSTFRATSAGTATVKATVTNGTTASSDYTKTFNITVTTASVVTHIITATTDTGGSISPSGSVAVNSGTSQTFTITPTSNYSIADVKVDGVSQGKITSYTFSNVTANHTISATFSYNGSSSGGGGSSDNNSPVIVTPPAPDKPNSPTQGEIKVSGTVDSKGNITVNITDKTVTDAFEKALADAKKKGNEKNGITVVLRVDTGSKTGSNVTVNLPKTVQDTIIAKKIVNTIVVVDNPDIRIGMDLTTVQEINKQAGTDVNITATRTDSGKLTGDAKKAIGSRPVFDLKVNYGNGKQVQSFGAGSVSITIPYTLGANEKAGNVQAVYVDAKGKVHWLTNSVYDSVEQVLRFATSHFSTYGIGYKQQSTAFTDIAAHWAKGDIEFVVSRGLFSGTSNTTFSPNTAMTRGMFVTALGRLANADVSSYTKSSFTDVKADAYYMGYIEWASKNNIVNGIGNGRFAPDQSITREQMAVIMGNYAKTIGYTLPKVHIENIFTDNAKISTYAKEAVKQMQMAGVISGKNGNLFDPQGTATRAEVSAVLRRFVELAISSDTAQGWSMNDSGKWMYFKDGKPLTGKQDIDGATYTFDQYGVTVDVPKNLRYTTYTVQKGDSFWSISRKLGCPMSELERLNNKSRFSLIHPGDVLRVPEK